MNLLQQPPGTVAPLLQRLPVVVVAMVVMVVVLVVVMVGVVVL